MKEDEKRKAVRDGYARIATEGNCCRGSGTRSSPVRSACCGIPSAEAVSRDMGYSDGEMASVPDGANLGLGCGNPTALASLKEGETVIDLGSGAGFDCFLAARKVGAKGKVIGVDMTPEMVDKACANASKTGCENVEFRLGEIENLPCADNTADIVISNCVINLVPDKRRAFAEAYRVLKPGGRLMVSDIVLLKDLPAGVRESVAALVGCVAGALLKDEYLGAIEAAGLRDIKVHKEETFPLEDMANDPVAQQSAAEMNLSTKQLRELAGSILSISVSAKKPGTDAG